MGAGMCFTCYYQVIPSLACRLRPHQREGVAFLFECTMGLRSFDGYVCTEELLCILRTAGLHLGGCDGSR